MLVLSTADRDLRLLEEIRDLLDGSGLLHGRCTQLVILIIQEQLLLFLILLFGFGNLLLALQLVHEVEFALLLVFGIEVIS